MSTPASRERWHRRPIELLAFAAWLVLASQVGDCYPFGNFRFFSVKMDTASRVLARDVDGRLHEPMAFDQWHCDRPISSLASPDKTSLVYMARHVGAAGQGQPLELLQRTWRFSAGVDEPEVTDEPLTRCTASPAAGSDQFFLWQRY
jgi:hypothetical protein